MTALAEAEAVLHPYEDFPRQELWHGITRREFFECLPVELELVAGRAQGASAMPLSILGCLTDEQLADFIPAVRPGVEISLRAAEVWGRPPGSSKPALLFRNDPHSACVFNQINGSNSLRQIALVFQQHSGLPFGRAFAYTRGFFLTLVRCGVCLPVNNPLLG